MSSLTEEIVGRFGFAKRKNDINHFSASVFCWDCKLNALECSRVNLIEYEI